MHTLTTCSTTDNDMFHSKLAHSVVYNAEAIQVCMNNHVGQVPVNNDIFSIQSFPAYSLKFSSLTLPPLVQDEETIKKPLKYRTR